MTLAQSAARRAAHGRTCTFVDSDAAEAAKEAGLRYVTDAMPGIRRERRGDDFMSIGVDYIGVDGRPLTDERVLARIHSLGITPPWTNVWISPTSRGHIQAAGRDAKGRKQYATIHTGARCATPTSTAE